MRLFLCRDGLREVFVEWGDVAFVYIKRLNTELVVRVFYYVAKCSIYCVTNDALCSLIQSIQKNV